MKRSQSLALALVGTSLCGLSATAAPNPILRPAAKPAARQVQIKVEWTASSPKSVEALTVVTTEDTTATVTLQPAFDQPEISVALRPHVNLDQTVTLRIAAKRILPGGGTDQLSTIRTLKDGSTSLLGGTVSKSAQSAQHQVFATATILKAAADPFAPPILDALAQPAAHAAP